MLSIARVTFESGQTGRRNARVWDASGARVFGGHLGHCGVLLETKDVSRDQCFLGNEKSSILEEFIHNRVIDAGAQAWTPGAWPLSAVRGIARFVGLKNGLKHKEHVPLTTWDLYTQRSSMFTETLLTLSTLHVHAPDVLDLIPFKTSRNREWSP